jgi:sugar lactone lactonase YvrE
MAVGEIATLRDDLMLGEGPRWHDGRLYVPDIYGGEVIALGLDGTRETVVAVPGRPSGLGWLPDGDLLVASMLDAAVLRFDGTSLTEVARLPAPSLNDMVVASDGRAYVGGMPDLDRLGVDQPHPGEHLRLPPASLYAVEPAGPGAKVSARVVADDLDFPNGTVITPDGRRLIVAETLGRRLTAFEIDECGELCNRHVWAQLEFMADGICLDQDGCVWVAAPEPPGARGFWRVAEGGRILDRVGGDRHALAVMLGGPERDHLFMLEALAMTADREAEVRVAGNARVRVGRVDVPGAGLP